MKIVIGFIVILMISMPAFSCDEACRKEKASAKHDIKFPSYLTWKYCESTKNQFMTSGVRSLRLYRDTRMSPNRKRGMKTTKTFVDQRKERLLECDQYMKLTGKGRIFEEEETTEEVFAALESVSKELDSLVSGVTYVLNPGEDTTTVASKKFDRLFKLVDTHKTMLQLKGQFVSRDR